MEERITKHTAVQTLLLHLLPGVMIAAVVDAILFSHYHFFSPWYFFSRVLMMVPLYYLAMKKKNIKFSIIAHTVANCNRLVIHPV